MPKDPLLVRVAASERQAAKFAARLEKFTAVVERASAAHSPHPVSPVSSPITSVSDNSLSSQSNSSLNYRGKTKTNTVDPQPPPLAQTYHPRTPPVNPVASHPFHHGTALIWGGRFLAADDFFSRRIRNPVHPEHFPFPWPQSHCHPRDKLLLGDVAAMRFWMCGAPSDGRLALERYTDACDYAETCSKYAAELVQTRTLSKDARAIANFDYEDCRAIVATATFFKAAFQIYTGAAVRGLVTLKRGWTLFADDPAVSEQQQQLGNTRRVSQRSSRSLTNTSGPVGISDNEREVTIDLKAREPVGLHAAWNFGRGMYLLFVAMAPSKMLKVLELVGFAADRRRGGELLISSLRQVVDHGGTSTDIPLAAAHCAHALAWDLVEYSNFNFSLGELPPDKRLQLGQQVVDRFLAAYEESPIFGWLGAVVQRRRGQFDSSLKMLKDVNTFFEQNSQASDSPGRVLTEAAFVSCLAEDDESVSHFSNLVLKAREGGSTFPIFPLTALGVSAALCGRVDEAKQSFTKATNLTSHRPLGDIENVLYNKQKAFLSRRHGIVIYGELLTGTFAHEDMEISRLRSVVSRVQTAMIDLERLCEATPVQPVSAGSSSTASWLSGASVLGRGARRDNNKSSGSPQEEYAVAMYIVGCLQSVAGDHALSIANLNEALTLAGGEAWISPFSHYQLAHIHWQKDDKQKAKHHMALYKMAGTGYEGARVLKSRVERLELAMSSALV